MLNLPKYIKSLRHTANSSRRGALLYGERQLSFEDSPVIHIKMHRPSSLRFKLPHIPCFNPAQVDFDFDFNDDDDNDNDDGFYYDEMARKSFLKSANEEEYYGYGEEVCEDVNCDDQGIDVKAEEFIANFYEQMKLQRQISYLQYHERHLLTMDRLFLTNLNT